MTPSSRIADVKTEITRHCIECGSPFRAEITKVKKFCNDRCRVRHSIQMLINELRRRALTIAEAANELSISESAVRNRIRNRNIETFKIGRVTHIRRSDARLLS